MERRFMHVTFDVTELSEIEVDRLGLEVGVQAEASDEHGEVPFPTFAFSWERPAQTDWQLPAAQAAALATAVTNVLTDQEKPMELIGIDVRPVLGSNDKRQWEIVTGVRDHDDDCDRTFITRIDPTGAVDDSFESN